MDTELKQQTSASKVDQTKLKEEAERKGMLVQSPRSYKCVYSRLAYFDVTLASSHS